MKLTFEELDYLKDYLKTWDKYSFNISSGIKEFMVPRKIDNIDIKYYRDRLLSLMSNKEKLYVGHLYDLIGKFKLDFECEFIQQFLILIEDDLLWEACCKNASCYDDVDNNGRLIRNKKIIFTDVYFTRLNKVIELDYKYTHANPSYDRARDDYLMGKFNIETCRIREYKNGYNTRDLTAEYDTLRILRNSICNVNVDSLDRFQYTSTLLNNFDKDYKEYFDIFESIRNRFGFGDVKLNPDNPIIRNQERFERVREIFLAIGRNLAY